MRISGLYRQENARIVAIVFSMVMLAGIGITCKPMQKQSGPREKVTLACAEHISVALVQVAYMKGFFADEGVDVVLQRHAFGKLALQAMLQGQADLATPADTPVMFAALKGEQFFVLADIETANNNITIIARKDRGVARPVDLKGKNIGVPFGTNADYFLNVFLLENNVSRRAVTIIDLKPDAMLAALKNGKVDAVSIWNPDVQFILGGLGEKSIAFFGASVYTETFCLTGTRDLVMKRPEVVKKILRALLKAEIFMRDNKAEAVRIAAQFSRVDEAVIGRIWNNFNFRLTLDQALLVSLQNQTQWAIRNKLHQNTGLPNYIDFIYLDGLQAVKPDAITLLR